MLLRGHRVRKVGVGLDLVLAGVDLALQRRDGDLLAAQYYQTKYDQPDGDGVDDNADTSSNPPTLLVALTGLINFRREVKLRGHDRTSRSAKPTATPYW